jgi:hypothetical protein
MEYKLFQAKDWIDVERNPQNYQSPISLAADSDDEAIRAARKLIKSSEMDRETAVHLVHDGSVIFSSFSPLDNVR